MLFKYRPDVWRPLVPLPAAGSECCTHETSPPIALGCEGWSPLALLSFAEDLRFESWPPPIFCSHQQANLNKKRPHPIKINAE